MFNTKKGALDRVEHIEHEIERLKHREEFVAGLVAEQACNHDEIRVHGWGMYETHLAAAATLKIIQASCDELREFISKHHP